MSFYAFITIITALTAMLLCAVGFGGNRAALWRSLAGFGGAMFLLALVCFCVFGFLASSELPPGSERLNWQAGYVLVGMASFVGILRTGRRSAR